MNDVFDYMQMAVTSAGLVWLVLSFAGVVYFMGLLVQRLQDRRLAKVLESDEETIDYATNSIYIALTLFVGQVFFLIPGLVFIFITPISDPRGETPHDVLIRTFVNIVFLVLGEFMHVITGHYFQRQRKRLVQEGVDRSMLGDLWLESKFQFLRIKDAITSFISLFRRKK